MSVTPESDGVPGECRACQSLIAGVYHTKPAPSAPDTAHRLARFFGVSPEFWLGLQRDFDLEEAARAHAAEYSAIEALAIPA